MEVALQFENLVQRFDRQIVLHGVTGTVASGEVLLVTGANGAGKTTLLRCLAGLLRPRDGTIAYTVSGRRFDVAERRRSVGYVGSELELYEPLSCRENLEFFARLRDVDADVVPVSLRRFGVPEEKPVGALSSGLVQRLRWAWALLHRPPLLLLDEPFQHLDRAGATVAREALAEHLSAGGGAVVASPDQLDVPGVAAHLELP